MEYRLMLSKAPTEDPLKLIKMVREMSGLGLPDARDLVAKASTDQVLVLRFEAEREADARDRFNGAHIQFERNSATWPGDYGVWALIDADDVALVSKHLKTDFVAQAMAPSFAHEEPIARWVCSGCGADVSALVWRAHICRAKLAPGDVTSRLRELVGARSQHAILAKAQPGRVDAGLMLVALHAIANKVTIEHADGQVWVRADFGSNGIHLGFGPNLYTAAAQVTCAALGAGL